MQYLDQLFTLGQANILTWISEGEVSHALKRRDCCYGSVVIYIQKSLHHLKKSQKRVNLHDQ